MSLKDFHVVFIIASAVLAFGFGFWAISSHGHSAVTGLPPTPGLRLTGGVSFVIALALSIYCVIFIRKLKAKV